MPDIMSGINIITKFENFPKNLENNAQILIQKSMINYSICSD